MSERKTIWEELEEARNTDGAYEGQWIEVWSYTAANQTVYWVAYTELFPDPGPDEGWRDPCSNLEAIKSLEQDLEKQLERLKKAGFFDH